MSFQKLSLIHQHIQQWYTKEGRLHLPWRNTTDPYHIYISEIMLQQTQVKTVLERYYFQFLERFPTLQALAEAELDEVLKMWEGLGYYNRAKNLHRCAKITSPHLPTNFDDLIALPGIGKNTALALCTFAYHQPVAIMEANVKRIICRIFAYENPSEKELFEKAEMLLDKKNPFDYNQAMMDIGAMVCTVKMPSCQICPWQTLCQAYEQNRFDYPLKKRKIVPTRKVNILVQKDLNGALFLKQREGKFLHGLWGFEEMEVIPESAQKIGTVQHQYTHFKLEATVFVMTVAKTNISFFNKADIETLALSGVDKKVLSLLSMPAFSDLL